MEKFVMTKKLVKNFISLTLMCTIVVSLCVVLYAAGTSPYFGEIMVTTLEANDGFFRDSFSVYTINETFSLGTKLDHVLSEHRLKLYCEGKSEVYTLSAVAD